MDDASKTREELLLELKGLRRQLAETRVVHELGNEGYQGLILGTEAERQRLLKTLEGERSRFKAIIDYAPEAMVVVDVQGHIVLTNRAADVFFSRRLLPGEEYVSQAGSRLYHPDHTPYNPRQQPLIRAALDSETHRNVMMSLRKPEGTWRDVLAHTGLIQNGEGEISGAVGVFQDVTGLKEIERQQQRLMAEIQEYSHNLEVANEELKIQAVDLQIQNDTLLSQADRLRVQQDELKSQKEEMEHLARELATGRNLLQSVLEQMPAGVIIANPSGQFILTNRRAEVIWQQPPGSLTDLEKFQRIPRFYPDGRPCPADDIPLSRALLLGETGVDEEILLEQEASGRLNLIHLNVNASPVRDQQGAIIAAVSTYEDITARKEAQVALRQSEERYRSLVELSPDAIVVHAKGKIVFVNPAAIKLFGASIRSDLLGQSLMDRIHPDNRDAIRDRIRRVRAGQTVSPMEEKVFRLDGEIVEVECTANGIMYQGRPMVQTILRDITERKRAREALREANEKLRAMIEASPLAIVHLDREGKILSCNPATERIFGWQVKELLGRPLPIVPEDKRKMARDVIQRAFKGELLTGLELRGRRKNGVWIDVSFSIAPMFDGNGEINGIVSLAEDITARKQAEAALAKSRAEFEAIFNSMSDAVIFADCERRIVLANPAVKTMSGYEPEELIGRSAEMLYVDRADFEGARERFYPANGRGDSTSFDLTLRRKDETLVSVESVGSPVKDAQGNILGGVGIHRDITARKVAEAALEESQRQTALLADFLENSSQPFAIGLLDGHIGMCNTAYQQLLGYDREELSRLIWETDLTPPEWREKVRAKIEELRRTGLPVRYEKEYLHKDGTRIPVEMFVHMRRDEHGQPLHYYTFVTDITARKKAEAALKQERQRSYNLLDTLPAFVSLYGADHIFRFANRRLREAFGETDGRFCYEVFHRRWTPCNGCSIGTVIDNQISSEFEMTSHDGRTLQIYQYPFRDTDGSACVLALALDITQRKEVEEALRQSEERFRPVAENIDDAIMLTSADWQRVHYISPAYERIWGRSCASLYQEPGSWLEAVAPEDLGKVKSALKDRMDGDFPENEFPPFRIRRPDGAVRWIAARFFPIGNEAGETYRIAGIATDITHRKEMEAVLQWRQEHLRQTAKMEAVGRLAGGVAHDFNNLLTIISGYGELLLAELKGSGQGRQQVQAILKAADHATAVTRQLLAFSRKQVLQPQIIDLNELISNLVVMFGRLVDEDVKISTLLEPKLGAVKADPSHMEQVIMNLAINALDAMPAGGTLAIMTANADVDPNDSQRHPEIAPGAYVVVAVRDTGIGMNREILSHIFEPFFTTKEQGKGTGLGLSMAYGIIKQSGGHILVESAPGKGSVFRIYLPRVTKARKPAVAAPPALPDDQGTGLVLVVEDEPGVRHVVERMLRLKGYSVLTARDGEEALKIAQDQGGSIRLLLTDVAMPVMGGRELAERLIPAHPKMKVLFMSGHTEDGVVRRGVRESVINFIQKPFRAEQLLGKVQELLADRKP